MVLLKAVFGANHCISLLLNHIAGHRYIFPLVFRLFSPATVDNRKMKIFKPSFALNLAACALLIVIVVISGSVSAYGDSASLRITVTATVLPKTPQIDYKKLQGTINRTIQNYKDKGNIRGKTIRINVNVDYPEGDQGITIEEIEY